MLTKSQIPFSTPLYLPTFKIPTYIPTHIWYILTGDHVDNNVVSEYSSSYLCGRMYLENTHLLCKDIKALPIADTADFQFYLLCIQ